MFRKKWYFFLLIGALFLFVWSILDKNYYIGGDVMFPMYNTDFLKKIFLWNNGGESLEYMHFFWYLYFGLLRLFGLTGYTAQKILIITLVIIGFLFSYLLYKELVSDKNTKEENQWAILSGAIFTFSPIYFLLVTAYLPLYGFPVCLYLLVKYLKKKSFFLEVIYAFSLNFFLFIDLPQPKIIIIFIAVSLCILFYISKTKQIGLWRLSLDFLRLNFSALILNAWIILPYLYSVLYGAVASFSGNLASHHGTADIGSAGLLYISRFFNFSVTTIYPVIGKYLLSIPFTIWSFFCWFVIAIGLLDNNNFKAQKAKTLLLFFLLLFMFLAKGPNPPFGEIYTKLVVTVPLLRIFRTSSSVVLGSLIFYILLLPLTLSQISQKYHLKNLFAFFLIFTLLMGYPVFLGQKYYRAEKKQSLERGVKIPSEYFELAKKIDNLDENYSLLQLPFPDGYVLKNWDYFGADLIYWISTAPTLHRPDQPGLSLEKSSSDPEAFGQSNQFVLNNVSHVLIQNDASDSPSCKLSDIGEIIYSNSFFSLLEVDKKYSYPKIYIPNRYLSPKTSQFLGTLTFDDPELKKTICVKFQKNLTDREVGSNAVAAGTKELTLLAKQGVATESSIITEIIVKRINQTKYKISISEPRDSFSIVLNEKYSQVWRVYPDKAKKGQGIAPNLSESHRGVRNQNKDFFEPFWETWFKKPVVEEQNHYLANGYGNGWIINTKKICEEDKDFCQKNSDGTFTLNLVIEFWPQRLLYFGLLISFIFIIIRFFYLLTFKYKKNA